jgi:hypothetical protein
MSKSEKQLERMRNNPRGDWVLDDFKTIGARCGLTVRHSDGSHATFSHAAIPEILTIPARRPIKPVYARKFIEMIDKVQALEADNDTP